MAQLLNRDFMNLNNMEQTVEKTKVEGGLKMTGRVKFFHSQKGYGFILPLVNGIEDMNSEEIFVQYEYKALFLSNFVFFFGVKLPFYCEI